jgi:ribosomal protein S27AE
MQEYEEHMTDPYGRECPYEMTDDICPECGDILVIDPEDDVLFCLSCGYEKENEKL